MLICKQEFIPPINGSMITVYFSQNNDHVINFTTDDMRYKFREFPKNKMDALHLTEITRTQWIETIDELWDELDKSYSGHFYF